MFEISVICRLRHRGARSVCAKVPHLQFCRRIVLRFGPNIIQKTNVFIGCSERCRNEQEAIGTDCDSHFVPPCRTLYRPPIGISGFPIRNHTGSRFIPTVRSGRGGCQGCGGVRTMRAGRPRSRVGSLAVRMDGHHAAWLSVWRLEMGCQSASGSERPPWTEWSVADGKARDAAERRRCHFLTAADTAAATLRMGDGGGRDLLLDGLAVHDFVRCQPLPSGHRYARSEGPF